MNIENELERLKNIRRQEVPLGVHTCITNRIAAMTGNVASLQWKWKYAAAAVLIMAVNIGVLVNKSTKDNINEVDKMVETMQLSPSNQLYYE